MELTYTIGQLRPYINWVYFFHAWGLGNANANHGGNGAESGRQELLQEACRLMDRAEPHYRVKALFRLCEANSDGDDLILDGTRVPLLRQQVADGVGQPCLCLADFVRPVRSGLKDAVGVFATSVGGGLGNGMVDVDVNVNGTLDAKGGYYEKMLAQTVADRLAEAAAEMLHQQVRREFWGYAPDEQLTMSQLHSGLFQGIRPAVGYPSLPDTSLNFVLDGLLHLHRAGIRLTESGAMRPHASVTGLMLAHPEARYFSIGEVGEDQLADYARRRGLPQFLLKKFLS